MQATAGSDGRVLVFDGASFRAAGGSGVACPAAAELVAPPGPAIRVLHWLPGAWDWAGTCRLRSCLAAAELVAPPGPAIRVLHWMLGRTNHAAVLCK